MSVMKFEPTEAQFVCTDCGHLFKATLESEISVNAKILGAAVDVFLECPKCKQVAVECDKSFAEATSILIKKRYHVDKAISCRWGEELYNPYIKIQSGSLEKLDPPKGWRDVTHESVKSFQVFAPIDTFGTAPDDDDPMNWVINKVFATEEEFNNAREIYAKRLLRWAKQLEQNTTLRVNSGLRGDSNIIDEV